MHTDPVFMKKGQGLVGVLLVLLVVFQDEGAPDEAAVGVKGGVLWPPNVDHHLVTDDRCGLRKLNKDYTITFTDNQIKPTP